jgi:hypothetical protein
VIRRSPDTQPCVETEKLGCCLFFEFRSPKMADG